MKPLIAISFICLASISCGKSESIENLQLQKDMTINRAHNANIMRQVNNDKIIMQTKLARDIELLATLFRLDGQDMTEETFLALPLDSLFYAEKRMTVSQVFGETTIKQQNVYEAYSDQYYTQHAFTPEHFELTIDENDLLQLNIQHAVEGDFYAYGFDKKTGKQGIDNYFDPDFKGSYMTANRILDRNIDELRIVVTLADSLYIDDYVIEDFYTHDH